jgi:hypothetical protein
MAPPYEGIYCMVFQPFLTGSSWLNIYYSCYKTGILGRDRANTSVNRRNSQYDI